VGRQMSKITFVPAEILDEIMAQFVHDFQNEDNLAVSGKSFLEQVIAQTLDEDLAKEVFLALGADQPEEEPFTDFNYVPTENLINLIKGEHPQVIALILSHINREKAAEIMTLLPEALSADVALRIIRTGQVQDDMIQELDRTLKAELYALGMRKRRVDTSKHDGIEALANILNEVDGKTEEYVLSQIEDEDGDLAETIRQKMFLFEDLMKVDDKGFREILQNVNNEILVKALKTATGDLKDRILNNLSERAAEMLVEDMEVVGPVRLSEVEEAQQAMIKVAKKLEHEGRIILKGKGKDDVLV